MYNQRFDSFSKKNGVQHVISTPRLHSDNHTVSKKRGKVFWVIEVSFIAISLLTFLLDMTTDILVGIEYLQKGEICWGTLTLVFVLVPSVVVQIISACWYIDDNKPHGAACWVLHIFQLQPLERYLSVLVAGAEARGSKKEEDVASYHYQMNDVCMLRLFEAFLESAPQLTLQIYVICCTDKGTWLSAVCALMSMLAVGWAVASYSHALRQAYREQYSIIWPGLLLQTLWHMAMATARVLSLVAFASIFKAWIFLVMGVHWMIMTTWVMLQNTDFCPTMIQERCFNSLVGVIYCYTFFNLKEGRSRYRMAAFYTFMFLENAGLITAWYFFRDEAAWYNDAILLAVPIGFVLGLMCMLTYYRFCHPSGPITCREETKEENCYTPQLPHKPSVTSAHLLRGGYSSVELPRRAVLLKQSHSRLPIIFKEVASPIPCGSPHPQHTPVYTDCTFQLEDSSAFQHYSVDASVCLAQQQQTGTLRRFDGITLSDDDSEASSFATLPLPSPSDSSTQTDSPMNSPPESPIRKLPSPERVSLGASPHNSRVKLVYVDDHLHTKDNISKRERSLLMDKYFNPPNASIRFIDATDTETIGDSDGDILNMSAIHFSYLRRNNPSHLT